MTNLLTEEAATGTAKEVYGEIKEAFGMIPNFFAAQGAVDEKWLELNWNREKQIMLSDGALDRKTKEIIAYVVSQMNSCEYCSLAHETMARMVGTTDQEMNEVKMVIELFSSFNAIADSLEVPCDITPSMAK